MIVFKNHHSIGITEDYINRVYSGLENIEKEKINYQDAVDLLIDCGELETGITDCLSGENGEISASLINLCRLVSINTGKIVCKLWQEKTLSNETVFIRNSINKIKVMEIPKNIKVNVPEGFVYYGLYPETYIDAANRFYEKYEPDNVICIGIRSIGTQLSALVSAQLQINDCNVQSFTVRLKGHPFSRYLVLSEELEDFVRDCKQCWFIIVDEGPGLSGSTIGGTVNKLLILGVDSKKIVIFPSWESDGRNFVSRTAREIWPEFEKFVGEFQHLWIKSGKLENGFNCDILHEFSAGLWRKHLLQSEKEYPAVHPHHEKRKYLLRSRGKENNRILLAKFVGLGNYGKEIVKRGKILGKSGFSPEIIGYGNGFVIMPFIEGVPMKSHDVDEVFMEFVAEYFALINNEFPAELTATWENMTAMILQNTTEGLGNDWVEKAQRVIKQFPSSSYQHNVVSIDGHVMSHEWIKTENGFKKVDSLEHWSDQFFIGCQNIAWDIAGFIIEFELEEKMKRKLVDHYIRLTNDVDIESRLPFYLTAYCAFRIGYITLANLSVPDTKEKERFAVLKRKFREFLKIQLLKNDDWK
ncbi:MAG TPA: hypothetical protein VKY57_02900 [Chitinispirillaceae bacterium]|nr:hypothetical protein [Chitinispirillaceae bacterium]